MCKGADRHQRLFFPFSYPVVLVSTARQWNCLEQLLEASHPCFDLDSSRGVIVRNTSLCPTLAAYDFDVTSGGGGTGRPWWTAVVHVYCGVDKRLVSKDTRKNRKSSNDS